MISKRANSIDSSGIRKVFDLAAKLKDPVNLSIGQPFFDASPALKDSIKHAIDQGKNSYTVTQGIAPLRELIFAKYGVAPSRRDSEIGAFVSSGVSGGLLLSYMSLLDPGDEILIPDPFFCMYRDLATLINAVPTYYDTYPDFKVSVEAIERAITPKTKALVINSPCNPTGYAIDQATLDAVVAIAKKHDIWLIYDEIYEYFSYDAPHANCFDKYEKTIVLNGFSKSHGITGWRVGYVVGPLAAIQAMLKIQQYSFVCAPSVAQYALAEHFDFPDTSYLTEYRYLRDFVYDGLQDILEVQKPGGAFYIFPKAPGSSGQAFVEKCIEKGLLIVPGNVFSRRDSHFRISFSANREALTRGVEIIRDVVKQYY